jgi:hypothetical protein
MQGAQYYPAAGLVRLTAVLSCISAAFAQVSVWTHHNDNFRSGANLNETILTRSNVNVNQFGKLFSQPVDGRIYAQPLYVPSVTINGASHNVVYVATMENKVYAFDADDNLGTNASPLWYRFLWPPVPANEVQFADTPDILGNIGVLSTPVIDLNSKTIYVVARTKEGDRYKQFLHAIDITNGQEKPGSPVDIQARVAGSTADAVDGFINFDPKVHNQRAGLALVNNVVYIAWASHTDKLPYHGWVIGYNTGDLSQASAFCVTTSAIPSDGCPDAQCFEQYGGGGIWQGGQAPAADGDGYLYFMSGNGLYSESGKNFGESFIKLSKDGRSVADWYTPSNVNDLNDADLDLGSGGTLMIPGTGLLVGGGKEGTLYLVDTVRGGSGMGHFTPDAGDDPAKKYRVSTQHVHTGPVYWDNGTKKHIYVWAEEDYLKVYRLNPDNTLSLDHQSRSAAGEGMPGGFLSLSANGTAEGILWASMPLIESANHSEVPGVLRAFDASDVTRELWSSRLLPQDDTGIFAKFSPPTVSNGKVYVPTFSNQLVVYGVRGLRGSRNRVGVTQNLTALGAVDWVHWGLDGATSVDRKERANQIGNFSRIGQNCGALESYADNPYGFTWTDGAPAPESINTTTGVLSQGIDCGFSITVPADTTPRTFAIYAGVWKARGKIVARLSDGGPADYVDTSLGSDVARDTGMYVFNYAAQSGGQNLTITFTQIAESSPGEGNITLQAAWLSMANGMLAGSVTRPADGVEVNLTSLGTADWAHWGIGGAPGLDRKSDGNQISDYVVVGGTAAAYTDNSAGFTWTNGAPTASATNNTTGVSVSGINNGFQISVPTDTDSRTLTIYVGVSKANGRMAAHLSDWSAPDYVDTSLNHGTGKVPGQYTFTYKATSANQTLTVTFTQDTPLEGKVTLQAATLSSP